MKKLKKALSALLAAALMCGLLTVSAFASDSDGTVSEAFGPGWEESFDDALRDLGIIAGGSYGDDEEGLGLNGLLEYFLGNEVDDGSTSYIVPGEIVNINLPRSAEVVSFNGEPIPFFSVKYNSEYPSFYSNWESSSSYTYKVYTAVKSGDTLTGIEEYQNYAYGPEDTVEGGYFWFKLDETDSDVYVIETTKDGVKLPTVALALEDPTTPDQPEQPTDTAAPASAAYKVTAKKGVNVRTGPGTSYKKAAPALRYGTEVQIVETKGQWGKLANDAGWVYLPALKAVAAPAKPAQPEQPAAVKTVVDTRSNLKLNVRTGPGTNYKIAGPSLKNGTEIQIVETKGQWGKLANDAGWVYLPATKTVK